MEKNKGTLISIIILLLLLVPCTIYGLVKHFEDNNKNKEFYFNGKLYFYNGDILLGKYECKTENCGYAEYQEIDTKKNNTTTLINNRYAFIKDGEALFVQDVVTNNKIIDFDEIKAYSIPIDNSSFVAKKDGKWGIVSIYPSVESVLEYSYDDVYLNYNNNYGVSNVGLDKVIVKEEGNYKILNEKEEVFITTDKIVEFTDYLIITVLDDGNYKFVDYENQDYLPGNEISKYIMVNNYLGVWTKNSLDVYFLNENTTSPLNYLKSYNSYAEIKVEDQKINIYEYNKIIDSYEKTIEN